MPDRQFKQRIVQELFFEQEHDALSIGYRHGLLRTMFVIGRTLFARRGDTLAQARRCFGTERVAVVFFENEARAIQGVAQHLRVDEVLRLDLRSLGLIRAVLGFSGALAALAEFLLLTARLKGIGYLRRCGVASVGWLLYRAFESMLAAPRPATIITTNMISPTSIGVHWGAIAAGKRTEFFEHATTPGIIMNQRGYHRLYVNFPHTRDLMAERGFSADRIEVLGNVQVAERRAGPLRLARAALCMNSYDSMQSILDISDVLARRGAQVTYRIHDADPRVRDITALAKQRGFAVSLARQSPIKEILAVVDLVITGNSNVIADALIAGTPVLYYWAGVDDMYDYYGFVKHYALPHARDPQSLEAALATVTGEPGRC
jgi:hypothetical protein